MTSYRPESKAVVVSYNSGRGLTCRAEVTPGTRPSVMLGQNTHPSRTSQNMNAPKATTMNIAIA